MDCADRLDDLTFRVVNFTGNGAARLRDRVKEKLKEFMGDYTDDTLVEYVIVLLKNGRRKEEARNELNVFLGDDSDSFVSWLWDHLQSDIDLYVKPEESYPDEVAKPKPMSGEQGERTDPHHFDSEQDRAKSKRSSESRHSKEWKGLVGDANEPPPIRSAVIANIQMEEGTHQSTGHVKRSPTPRPIQRKRGRIDERPQVKREVVSKATIGASRRLLQFAVRDAIGTSSSSRLTTEPSLKRLRSVVSMSTEDSSLEDRRQRIRSVARVPNAMAVAIKAVEEAAKDVTKVKSSRNVFDRLGRGRDISDATDLMAEYREAAVEGDGEYEDFTLTLEETLPTYHQRCDYTGKYVRNVSVLESDTGMACDYESDNEGYDNDSVLGCRFIDVSETDTSGRKKGDTDSLLLQYSAANNVDEIAHKPWEDDNLPASVANSSSNIVNRSMNVNTWKLPHYQEPRGVSDVDSQKLVQESELGVGRSGVQLMKENNNPVMVSNGNAKSAVDTQRECQKTLPSTGLHSTGRLIDDADSRSIFVSNVHFAATKDSLSRHFNKFGEVLKVVIITDAATGQPKGSAYVEFMRKEAAEHALSLDGTSFMSRILKVVKKSSAHLEAGPVVSWPRVAWGSPFAASRFARIPFPRGMSSIYRPRLPIKSGARSLQWKRGVQITPSKSSALASVNTIPSPTTRSLTYVRIEPKTNGNSGTA